MLQNHQIIEGKLVDLVQFLLSPEEWAKARERQLPLARLAGEQLLEWEKTQIGVRQPWQ